MRLLAILTFTLCLTTLAQGQASDSSTPKTLRIGIVGLDTSHVTAFTKAFNADPASAEMQNCRVVAAYPYGSRDIETSYSRIPKFTAALKAMDVAIVDSIAELLTQVDCVLLETNDGKRHLEQALEIFAAGKPVFIDKPAGSNLSEVVAIYRAAQKFNVPMFSSSSLRYTAKAQEIRVGSIGDVIGCTTHSPCALEPSHSRLYWYGIHGVELLFTCMGPGCESVSMTATTETDVAVGVWPDGRLGTFRGIRSGKSGYGGTAFGSKSITDVGTYDGYRPLVVEIAKFFRTQKSPVAPAETINLYAFMTAAQQSANKDGAAVLIADVMKAAELDADRLLLAAEQMTQDVR